jgi:hypothetical protein
MFLNAPRGAKLGKDSRRHVCTVLALVLLTALTAGAQQQPMDSMPGMDMSGKTDAHDMHHMHDMASMEDMGDMGPSMAAMAGHMTMTPMRPAQPGDEEKAKAVVATAKAIMERYQDYHQALADGYIVANPKVKQAQYHFIKEANNQEALFHFDPTKPTALLYRRTPHQQYKLEGVMYTANRDATPEELNARIPLSMARWHEHINFCAAPADRINDYSKAHPKFGMFGSIRTKEACDAEGGTFLPTVFNWMIHVFPYESGFKDVFSMNVH